ncbi:hypothetical protein, partial [Parendozoicomonas sp. Alg238-R29]|uniref:hypothetical protein n=1 Tax=Parendozoicomonas sp. Alg238-R29 TaxID=2993446 RepID=UPI00248D95B0
MRSYSQLTRLTHCLDPDGKLDHEGVNYFYGFQKEVAPSVKAPLNRPACIRDVIKWLDDSIAQLEQQECDNDQQKERGYLQNQRQQLQTWLCRNTNDLTEKQKMLAEEEVKIRDFIDEKINRLTATKETGVVSPLVDLTAYYLHPHELWPDQMKPSLWRNVHIRCKSLSQSGPVEFCAKHPLDELHCYKPCRPEYADAMKEAIARVRNKGISLETIKNHGIHQYLHSNWRQRAGQGQGMDILESDSQWEIVIPHIEGIPADLHGTTQWSALTDAQWSLLDVDASEEGHSLKTALEHSYYANRYEVTRVRFCTNDEYIKTWASNPDIKEAFKTGTTAMKPLFHHLIKLSGTEIKELTSHWQPLDSLFVCKADTPIYNEAINAFLEQQLKEGKNARIIANIFNKPDPNKQQQYLAISEEIKLEKKVEKPSDVATSGDWTGEDVMTLINSRQIPTPTNLELLPKKQTIDDVAESIQKILIPAYSKESQTPREKLNYQTVKVRIRWVINQQSDELLTSIAKEYGLHKGCFKPLKDNAVIRYLVTILDISVPDDNPELQAEMTLRDMDKLIAISEQHPDWRTEMTSLISRLRSRGLNDRIIADLFNNGNSNASHRCGVQFPALPLPPECTNANWNANIVETFFLATQVAQLENKVKQMNELLGYEQEKCEKAIAAQKKPKKKHSKKLKRLQDAQNTVFKKTKSDHQKEKKEFDEKIKKYTLLKTANRKQAETIKSQEKWIDDATRKYNQLFDSYKTKKEETKNLQTSLEERTQPLISEEEKPFNKFEDQHEHTEELKRLKEENKLALEKADLEYQENTKNLLNKIEELKQELRTVTLSLGEKGEELDRLQQEINQKDQILQMKEVELQKIKSESQRRFNYLQTEIQEAHELKENLQEKSKLLDQKNVEVSALDKELAKIKEEWSSLTQELVDENRATTQRVTEKGEELDRLQQELSKQVQ